MLVKLKPCDAFPSLFDGGSLRQIMKTSLHNDLCHSLSSCGLWNNFNSWSSYLCFFFFSLSRGKLPFTIIAALFSADSYLFFPQIMLLEIIRDHSDHLASKWNIYMRWLYILLCLVAQYWSKFTDQDIMTWQESNESPFEKYNSKLTHVNENCFYLLKATS